MDRRTMLWWRNLRSFLTLLYIFLKPSAFQISHVKSLFSCSSLGGIVHFDAPKHGTGKNSAAGMPGRSARERHPASLIFARERSES